MRIIRFVIYFSMIVACMAEAVHAQMPAGPSANSSPQTSNNQVTPVIAGHVSAEGKPLAGALITLWRQPYGDPDPQSTIATGQTDNAGNYELKNVPTGNYYVGVTARGFVTGKENDMLAKLRWVTVVGGKSVGPFNFDLVREGVISGTVTDAAGKPLANIPITLKAETIPDGSGPAKYAENIRTDAEGHYRITNMPAGKYRVAAGYYPAMYGTIRKAPYERLFYPKVAKETDARILDVGVGTEVTGVDFNLGQPVKTFTLRARIVDQRNGKTVAGVNPIVTAYQDGREVGHWSPANKSNDQGGIVITDIPPGEYSIKVPGSNISTRDESQTPNYNGESDRFQVADQDVDVEVRVNKAGSVAGHIVIEGPARPEDIAQTPVMFLSGFVETNPFTPSAIVRATIQPDGAFLFTGLRAGKLKLNSPALSKNVPLVFVRTEREGVSVDGVDVQFGDEVTGVKVVMAYATGGVHGFVKLDDGSIPQGLIGLASVWQGNKPVYGRSVVNQNGEFILDRLVAGEYELMVVAHDATGRQWQMRQPVKVFDDKVTEAKMAFDSKVKPNPDATSKSYLQP
jgi:hypothetical protein